RIEVVAADATKFPIQSIVNAANARLRGGNGIDGAIHRAAGPGLLAELKQLYPDGGLVGLAYPTGAHNIQTTQHIIHAVGPDYTQYKDREADAREALWHAHLQSLEVAKAKGVTSIAFPTISTGIFGFPKEEACQIALQAVREFLGEQENYQFERIVFLVW
ncbi:A1pp-domain-containing protein, partial [Stipitochalara longipes BDJ]